MKNASNEINYQNIRLTPQCMLHLFYRTPCLPIKPDYNDINVNGTTYFIPKFKLAHIWTSLLIALTFNNMKYDKIYIAIYFEIDKKRFCVLPEASSPVSRMGEYSLNDNYSNSTEKFQPNFIQVRAIFCFFFVKASFCTSVWIQILNNWIHRTLWCKINFEGRSINGQLAVKTKLIKK